MQRREVEFINRERRFVVATLSPPPSLFTDKMHTHIHICISVYLCLSIPPTSLFSSASRDYSLRTQELVISYLEPLQSCHFLHTDRPWTSERHIHWQSLHLSAPLPSYHIYMCVCVFFVNAGVGQIKCFSFLFLLLFL
jgi:hypothetical protein